MYRAAILIHTTDMVPYDLKSDFHGDMSTLREQTVTQWREFVVTNVLADYQKTSRLSHNHHSDGEIPPSSPFFLVAVQLTAT